MLSPEVVDALVRLNAGVTVGLLDLSPQRAQVVSALNARGVPVSAWVLVERERGYFATHDNAADVHERVEQFLEWTRVHHLRWERVGLDFEPALHEVQQLMKTPVSMLASWLRRAGNLERFQRAQQAYLAIARRLTSEGLTVETYQFPLVLDDGPRRTAWQRVVSGLSLEGTVQTVMLYTSLMGPLGHALLHAYAPQARSIAVGSTGGGIDPLPKLTWEALERDLLVAAAHASDVRIFSLEGCVEHGYLERLEAMSWAPPVAPSALSRVSAGVVRALAGLISRVR